MPRLRSSGNPAAINAPKLYKKQPIIPNPRSIWAGALCTHLIHRPVHSLWGQVKKLDAPVYTGFRDFYRVYDLTLIRRICRRPKKVQAATAKEIARSQQLHRLAHSFQSLTTDLSTGCLTIYECLYNLINLLTNNAANLLKVTVQKTATSLKSTKIKACSQLLPRYPQAPPQQTGTSQNDDKTAIYSGFMSRFRRVAILFSTISSAKKKPLKRGLSTYR